MFFSWDAEGSFGLHETAKAARDESQSVLDDVIGTYGHDGLPENITQICWGVVLGEVNETDRRPISDGEKQIYDENVTHILRHEMRNTDAGDLLLYLQYTACLTGDCPHDNVHDCMAGVTSEIEELSATFDPDQSN